MDGAVDVAGFAPNMGTVSSHGPVAMRHVRQDPQSSFSPESAFSQGLMGTPDWHSTQMMMNSAPDSYMSNHSFDLDMWVSASFLEPHLPSSIFWQQHVELMMWTSRELSCHQLIISIQECHQKGSTDYPLPCQSVQTLIACDFAHERQILQSTPLTGHEQDSSPTVST